MKKITLIIIILLWVLRIDVKSQSASDYIGVIPGTIDVSPSGAATYTIPIEVVPGTLGIQPVLAISYNSQGGMSILGEKWHLSGLSAINRVPQDIYHENNKTSVQLDYQDRFTLDGNRLLKSTENAYGANGTEYVPEFENFSSVKSFGILGNGPLYFEVTNADGCIIQYGNSSDSRQVVGGTVFNWLINKITDPFGNYMTFSYGNSNREIWIEQIDYTGNRSLTPYARIKFEYLSDGSHYRSGFVVGYEIKQTRLLEKIRIQYDENGFSDIRRYEFSYLNTYPPRLNTITQYGTEGERLLPTTIIWEDTHAGSFAEMEYDLNISGGITAYPADLNGDKYSDFIALIGSSWVPFLNSDGTFIRCPAYSSGLSTHYSLNNCVIGDWDGDGKDEVISVHYSAAQALYTLNLSKLRPDLSAITTNTLFSYRPEVSGGSLIVKSGYFSGNGKAELLLWENEKITIKGQNVEASYPIPRNYPLTLLDYNGNGKTDILLMSMDSSRYIVCEYNSSSNLIEIIADVSNHNLGTATPFVGDFNGDGISDLLWRVQGSSFKIALGTGNGFSTPISKGFTHNSNSYPVICDINGDGKDDFIGLQSESPYTIHYYLSQGYHSNGLHFSQGKIYQIDGRHPDNYFLTMGDFNGEHTIDYLSISKTGGASKLHSIKNNLQEHLVKQVKNGFNFTIDIKYKPFYSLGIDHASFKKQIVSFFLPEYIEMPSGFGSNKKRINYEFSDPIVSYKRNAFLGFTSFNAYDNVSTEQTQLSFFKNNIRDILLHRSKSLQKANIPIEDSYYVYSIRDLGFGNFLPYISSDTTIDRLSQRVTETTRQVDAKGRINRVETKILPLNSSQFLIKEVTLYTYTDVALVNAATVSKLRSVSKNSYLQNSQYSQNKYTLYQYTTNGKPASCQETDTEGTITTTYGNYDSFGNAKRITVSSPGLPSRIENKTFDPTGRFMISYKNPLSQTTSYSHDPRTGNLLSSTDINGLTTTFQYDEFGRETLCRHPDGTQTETSFFWTFDSDYHPGYYAKRTGYTASSSDIVYYDQYNRAICQKTGNNGYVDTRYDNKGRVYQVSFPYKTITDQDGSKQWTQYYYNSDPLGRLSREISPQRSLEYTYGTNSVTVTDTRANVSSTKTYDVAGRLSSAIDYGGTITYSYSYVSQQGKIRNLETISLHGNTTTIITDCRGNRLSIDEPNAGLITSSYNGYGQLVSQTDANGNTTSFLYDVLGRVTRETMSPLNGTPVVTSYEYDHYEASKRGRGQISRIVTGGATKNLFRCDALGRLAEEATYIDGTEYKQLYTYNSAGQLYEITYPDGFAIVHNYDIYGDLYEIRRKDNNALIYKKHEKNQFNKVTRFSYGNNVATERTYNDFGQLTRIKTGNKKNSGPIVRPPGTGGIGVLSTTLIPVPENFTIDSTYQNLDYTYNTRGLMTQRANLRNNQNETFTYDKLDRLTSYRINNYLNRNFAYDNSGNLTFNSGLGNLNYEGEKPHAVTSVDMFGNSTIPTHDCIVTYNQFHKPTTITEGTNELLISYGVDKQREKSIYKTNGTTQKTKIFVSALYEKETFPRAARHLDYIYAETGLVAIRVKSGLTAFPQEKMYYVLSDHLGSYNMILDQDKNVVDSLHFDPWGNRKRYSNWTQNDTRTSFLFDRGFTGHEHLDAFKIINMNGRLYDPVIGRFFSPDPYVQLPDFTQNFNRYSYCFNNPLMFTDPSGESVLGDIFLAISNILSIPARLITEGVEWVNDQINGTQRNGDYFNLDYLAGKAAPYNVPVNYYSNLTPNTFDYTQQPFHTMSDEEYELYYSVKRTVMEVPLISYRTEDGREKAYTTNFTFRHRHLMLYYGKRPRNASDGKWADYKASAGMTYGSSWFGGFFSTLSVGMREFTTASKVFKGLGGTAGVLGLGATALEVGFKYRNGEANTADWINLTLTGTIVGVGLAFSAPAIVAGSAVAGFGYGIYRVAAGDKADAWINNKIGYR